jgi:hypothetical protein
MAMSLIEGFLYGVFGGGLAELVGLFKLRHEASGGFPAWLKSIFYWIITGLMILGGGGLVVIYLKSKFTLNALLAVNIGASAPLIIGALISQAPHTSVGRID